jgi:hypothetical protein
VARKFPIPEKRALAIVTLDPFRRKIINLPRRDAGLDERRDLVQNFSRHPTRRTHQFQIVL